jgi:hypothetical protein
MNGSPSPHRGRAALTAMEVRLYKQCMQQARLDRGRSQLTPYLTGHLAMQVTGNVSHVSSPAWNSECPGFESMSADGISGLRFVVCVFFFQCLQENAVPQIRPLNSLRQVNGCKWMLLQSLLCVFYFLSYHLFFFLCFLFHFIYFLLLPFLHLSPFFFSPTMSSTSFFYFTLFLCIFLISSSFLLFHYIFFFFYFLFHSISLSLFNFFFLSSLLLYLLLPLFLILLYFFVSF